MHVTDTRQTHVIHMSDMCQTHAIHMLDTYHAHVTHMHVIHMLQTHVRHMSDTCQVCVRHVSYTCQTHVRHMSDTCQTHVVRMSEAYIASCIKQHHIVCVHLLQCVKAPENHWLFLPASPSSCVRTLFGHVVQRRILGGSSFLKDWIGHDRGRHSIPGRDHD